ncbi:MAG: T9SS type A sorting domain-containing protein [Bacteroidetes bacterium]|nr:MAG: T9SS type A sorting domain-containing protein [Bacteroidota bacterium]
MLKTFFTIILAVLGLSISANTIVVSSTNPTGTGSLDSAITAAAPSDTITFDSSLLSGGNAVISGILNYSITKPLTILGVELNGNRVVLDGQSLHRIFDVNLAGMDSARTVRFLNLDFINGSTPDINDKNGGAIQIISAHKVTIENCRFSNCYGHMGGSVLYSRIIAPSTNTLNYLNITHSEFSNNTVGQNTPGNGLIKTTGTENISIQNCHFHDNINVSISISYSDSIAIQNSLFEDNGDSAAFATGLCVNVINSNHLSVDSSEFQNNFSIQGGTGLSAYTNQSLKLSNSTFTRNTSSLAGGGAFVRCDDPNKALVENCLFYKNKANDGGGLNAFNARLVGCTIRSNVATFHGGGLACRIYTELIDCQLDSNQAGTNAGGILSFSEELLVKRSTFAYNTSNGTGGAIQSSGSPSYSPVVQIQESTFAYNQGDEGGFIYSSDDGYIQIENSTLIGNTATTDGSLLYYHEIDSISFKSTIVLNHGTASQAVKRNRFASGPVHFKSGGFNLLGPELGLNYQYTDITNATATDANLGTLSNNGNTVLTMLPQTGSKAINSGSPGNFTIAQNDSIRAGRRDRGAAESMLFSNYEMEESTVCDSLYINNQWVDSSGTYTSTFTNAAGADSTFVNILTIIPSFHQIDSVQSCQPFTWRDGNVYQTDTTATWEFVKTGGCDSTYTLHFSRLNKTDSITVYVSSCDSTSWIDGQWYKSDTITPWINLTSMYQCDSLVRLDFEKLEPTDTGFMFVNTCYQYTWIDGKPYATDTTAHYTLTGSNGCDSVVELQLDYEAIYPFAFQTQGTLRVLPQPSVVQWVDCATWLPISGIGDTTHFTPTSNGSYAAILINAFCTDTTNCITVTGINLDEEESNHIYIYPNPTASSFSVIYPEGWGYTNLVIMDVTGRAVFKKLNYRTGEEVVPQLPPGNYIVRLRSANGNVIEKRLVMYNE